MGSGARSGADQVVVRRQAGMAPEPRRLSVGECTDRTEASCQFSRKRAARGGMEHTRWNELTDPLVECVGYIPLDLI